MRLEVVVNQICNAACLDCNRAIGLAKFSGMTLTADIMRQAVDQVIEQGKLIRRCTLSGGEPLLNPELEEIMHECDRLPGLRWGRILTNDRDRHTVRKTLKLLPRWKWVPAPIDDPSDPWSGKDVHEPFFISPADHGLHSTWDKCRVRGYCGKGFDKFGWSMCGVAATIGRLVGVNPYWHDGPQLNRKQEDICKHCVYGMTRPTQRQFTARVHRGEIARVSKTYEEGLERHRKAPMEFEPFEPCLDKQSASTRIST